MPSIKLLSPLTSLLIAFNARFALHALLYHQVTCLLYTSRKQSLVPRSLVSIDGTNKHEGSSATPPSASLYRERIIYDD